MNQCDYLNQCSKILNKIFQQLDCEINNDWLNQISQIIVETMEGNNRYFHSFDHILTLIKTDDPLIILAALFHDLIYIQVDQQIRFNLTPYLNSFIEEKNGDLFIKSNFNNKEKELEIILRIFDVNKEDNLSQFRGINEFLSALSAAMILSPYLPLVIITRLVTIIELTIPFRKPKKKDLSIIQQLQKRLEGVNEQFHLGLEKADIILTITQAVELANLDISGFALTNVEDFIYNTWLLLPETNHGLISLEKSTVNEYCIALAKTEKFISSLYPELIFHRYNNEPSLDVWQNLMIRCENNLKVTKLYLSSIVLSLSIIDALCSRFSHHICLSFLFNFSSYQSNNCLSFIDFLPTQLCHYQTESTLEKTVLSLIKSQPKPDFFPTLKYNILVDFIVNYITLKKVPTLLPKSYLFLEEKISSEEFIQNIPDDLIKILAKSIALLLAQKQKIIINN